MNFSRVLFPVDFSEFSRQTLVTCSRIFAPEQPREFHFLYVWRQPSDMVTWDDPKGVLEMELKEFTSNFSHAGDHTRIAAVLGGDPALQICDYARERRCDLIALATHGRTGLRHLVMGSTAERVVRHASCEVLTIPGLAQPRDGGSDLPLFPRSGYASVNE